jgi:hypothetical protein
MTGALLVPVSPAHPHSTREQPILPDAVVQSHTKASVPDSTRRRTGRRQTPPPLDPAGRPHSGGRAGRVPPAAQPLRLPDPPNSDELARTLNSSELAFRPLADLLFALYLTLRPHPDCPTWQTHRRAAPAVREALQTLVHWTATPRNARFSQARLAGLVGLHRTAITRLLGMLQAAGVLTRENPDGHGRFQHGLRWTAELVDLLRARSGWEERLTLLWHVTRLPADLRPSDALLRSWLLRPNGTAALASWYRRAQGIQRWRLRRDERARREAVDRAAQHRGEGEAGQKITPPAPPRMRKGRLSASPNAARAREDRRAALEPDDPQWAKLDRADVADRLAADLDEVAAQRAEYYRAAELVGERRPAAGWRQIRNLARRARCSLADVVGRFVLASDRVRRDETARVRASAGRPDALPPIRCPERLAMWFVRVDLGVGPGPTETAPRWRPLRPAQRGGRPPAPVAAEPDDMTEDGEDLVVEVSGRQPLYVPESDVPPPAPGQRRTYGELWAQRRTCSSAAEPAGCRITSQRAPGGA